MAEAISELRRAAQRIREYAGQAYPSPWTAAADDAGEEILSFDEEHEIVRTVAQLDHAEELNTNVFHAALWQPSIAVLVAEWLESEAGQHHHRIDGDEVSLWATLPPHVVDVQPSIRLARAINGEADRG